MKLTFQAGGNRQPGFRRVVSYSIGTKTGLSKYSKKLTAHHEINIPISQTTMK